MSTWGSKTNARVLEFCEFGVMEDSGQVVTFLDLHFTHPALGDKINPILFVKRIIINNIIVPIKRMFKNEYTFNLVDTPNSFIFLSISSIDFLLYIFFDK
jgi:hypothetical protein